MSDVNCPHCGFEHDTMNWVECFTRDGDDFDIECRSCKEVFNVVANISVSYAVASEVNDG